MILLASWFTSPERARVKRILCSAIGDDVRMSVMKGYLEGNLGWRMSSSSKDDGR